MHRTKGCWLLAFWFLAAPAVAQEPVPVYSPTFDMQLPAASVASCPGPLSLGYNPAGLAWAGSPGSTGFLYLHQERLDTEGSAEGVFTGRSDGLLLHLGRLGLGVQWIRPYEDVEEWDYIKYTLAFPFLTRGKWFSLGFGVEILDPTETNESPSVDFMLGALLRPFRYLSIGIVGRNLGRGLIGTEAARRTWISPGEPDLQAHRALDLGVALRPLWFAPERMTLAVDFRFSEDVKDAPIRFTGNFAILEGISLFGTADLDGNFGAGLVVDFQRVGAGGYVSFVNSTDVEPDSMLLMARVSTDNLPGFTLGRGRTAEFKLDAEVAADPEEAWGFFRSRPTLDGLIQAIHRAAGDVRVDSILLQVTDPSLGWTDIQELREALAEFKKTGKKVVFHLEEVNDRTYYLATAGHAIYVAPANGVSITGPSVQATFFKGTLDMIGANVEYQRVGEYKSAVEQLANEEPSGPYLETMNSLADEAAEQMIGAISEGRGLDREQVKQLIDRGLMHPTQAQEKGLVDGVLYFDEIDESLAKALGHGPSRLTSYLRQSWHRDQWDNPPLIAVVHARGAIAAGGLFGQGLDARRIAEILSGLRQDGRVDAVVLRIDSPGGTIAGSDLIWREVKRLKERKPVVVSMGAVAASGGYYIAAPADAIVANPGTITGSIGVFALFFDLSELYAKIGISHETVKRGKLADLGSTFRGRTEDEMALLEEMVKGHYQAFIEKVAQGRSVPVEEIDAIGRGRVWTGRQAKEKGLVDRLGGLEVAIDLAKERIGAGTDDPVGVIHLPRPRFSFGRLMREMGLVSDEPLPLPAALMDSIQHLAVLSTLNAETAVALMPVLYTLR